VNERISAEFKPVIFWFNPNIEPKEEHERRLETLKNFTESIGAELIVGTTKYENDNSEWFEYTKEYTDASEGGRRCQRCIEFRMKKTAERAKALGLIFTTTLSVSPHKNSDLINKIGEDIGGELDIIFLPANFKKENGYLRSIVLSKKFNLYRQNYCGCRYSKERVKSRE